MPTRDEKPPPGAAEEEAAPRIKVRRRRRRVYQQAADEGAEKRKKAAVETVERFALWSAGIALVPLPIVDLAALSLLQLKMLRLLTEIYGIDYSRQKGKIYVAALLSFIVPASLLVRFSGLWIALRFVAPPAGAFVLPAMAWACTQAVGLVFMRHFENGGTLDDFAPEESRRHLKRLYPRAKSRPGV